MSLAAVPDDDELCDGLEGRQVRAMHSLTRPPVAWISGRPTSHPGLVWARLSAAAAVTGLQPVLPCGLLSEPGRPWDAGEFTMPEDTAGIDRIDAAGLLYRWWHGHLPDEEDEDDGTDLAARLGPFGRRFPGLAPAVGQEIDPEWIRRALDQYTPPGRIAVVPAARPADVLPRLGWGGACNHRTAAELAAVLRSWEDRFGARLLGVGFEEIRLLVSRPPQTLQAAWPLAAEHYAFSDEAFRGLRTVPEMASALVNNPFWDFWWD